MPDIGSIVVVREKQKSLYRQHFGDDALAPRRVIQVESIQGRKRYVLDGTPWYLWGNHTKLVKEKGGK